MNKLIHLICPIVEHQVSVLTKLSYKKLHMFSLSQTAIDSFFLLFSIIPGIQTVPIRRQKVFLRELLLLTDRLRIELNLFYLHEFHQQQT